MEMIFNPDIFYSVITAMAILAVIVFFALQRIEAAYGMTYSKNGVPLSITESAGSSWRPPLSLLWL